MEEDPFPYPDNSFSVVFFCEIIEHLLMNPLHSLNEIHRVLAPDGTLVITTPNVARLENVLALVAGTNIYDPYSGHGPYGRHNREYTLHDLAGVLEFAGFTIDRAFTADSRAPLQPYESQPGYAAVAPALGVPSERPRAVSVRRCPADPRAAFRTPGLPVPVLSRRSDRSRQVARAARGYARTVDDFLLFAGSASRKLGGAIASYLDQPLAASETHRFSEGNLFVRVLENVRGRDTFLVQGTAFPANDNFMELLFWIDALKRASAASVTAVIPYFSYAKGDKKDEPRVSIRARVCADAIEAAGVDRVVTMDLHAPQLQGFFHVPVDDLYAMPILCDAIAAKALPEPRRGRARCGLRQAGACLRAAAERALRDRREGAHRPLRVRARARSHR